MEKEGIRKPGSIRRDELSRRGCGVAESDGRRALKSPWRATNIAGNRRSKPVASPIGRPTAFPFIFGREYNALVHASVSSRSARVIIFALPTFLTRPCRIINNLFLDSIVHERIKKYFLSNRAMIKLSSFLFLILID